MNANKVNNPNHVINPSYNSFGQVGLIQTPSAETRNEGTIAFTFNKNNIWKFGTLTVSPFDWLEASYFYYRPSDLAWYGVPGYYLDKGFNVKFKYTPNNKNLPQLAIGLDDFAGTGFFSREYIVSTKELKNTKISLGMGWGYYSIQNGFDNPLSFLSKKLDNRPALSENYGNGGTPAFDKWFRGDAALFGGIEYFIPGKSGVSIKLEYDAFEYLNFSARNSPEASFDLRKKDSDFNLGINYPLNNFINLEASFIKGNTLNLSFTIAATFNEDL